MKSGQTDTTTLSSTPLVEQSKPINYMTLTEGEAMDVIGFIGCFCKFTRVIKEDSDDFWHVYYKSKDNYDWHRCNGPAYIRVPESVALEILGDLFVERL
jgi:hypothetical protein